MSFLSQLGRSAPYNVFIFCKKGDGRLKLTAKEFIFDQGAFDPNKFIKEATEGGAASIIGPYAGQKNEIFYFQKQ